MSGRPAQWAPAVVGRPLAVGLFLFALYWLTASGAFHSIDEQAVFAVSRNLVLHGDWDQSALFWGEPYSAQARVGLDGETYSKYGIGHSLLVAVPLALARLIPGATLASSAMIVNGVATALTGTFLVLVLRRLGYSERVGVSVALLFGLATFAWVYAKTMFSEPIVGLGWTIAVWLLLGGNGWRHALLAGVVLGITVAVRPASVLVVPLFALPLWEGTRRASFRRLVAFGVPLALAGLALLAFNQARFGDPFEFGYSESFNGSLLAGLTGFLFSLDRSLFLFAPPLMALFWSVPAFLRRHGRWGWTLLAVGLLSLLLYSLWPVFWGGPVWGPRYLLPVVPLLVILLAPAAEAAWEHGGWRRWALALLALLGVAMQVPGVFWNSLSETQTLGQRYPLWQLPPRAEWLDVAWLSGDGAPIWGALVVAGVLALLALAALRWPRPAWLGAASVAAVVGSLLLLGWLGQSGLGYTHRPVYDTITAQMEARGREGDALLLNPAPHQEPIAQLIWFMNQPDLTVPLFGVYRDPPETMAQPAERVDQLAGTRARLWLVTEGVGPGDPTSTAERRLAGMAPMVGTEWLEENFRLTLFEAPRPPTEQGSPGTPLGEIVTLQQWAIAFPGVAENSVQVTLQWQAAQPTAAALHTFVQLLDEQGQFVAGWDSVPQAGFAPTTAWQPNAPVTEHLALVVPEGTTPGTLRLIAGMYDPATGQRLLTPDGADAIQLTTLAWPSP